jgi:regulatory protein
MPTITSIKPQKNRKRVNVYLDGKFGFGIDLENFVKLGLKVEQELSDEEVAKIVKKAEFHKTLDKLLRFATLRPRSEKEVGDWLKRKKIHKSLYEDLFNRLNRLELVGDKKFAKWWVEQRQAFRPKSLRMMNQELRIKGVDKETIKEVLANMKIDEEKIARELLEKKAYKWKNLPKREAWQKMSAFLARKGFGWEVIKRVLGG